MADLQVDDLLRAIDRLQVLQSEAKTSAAHAHVSRHVQLSSREWSSRQCSLLILYAKAA
jgi:hypothetical protein